MIIIISLYCILTILSILHIILYGSRPIKSLSWLLIVLIFPFIGIVLYIVFGINRRRLKFFKLKQTVRRRLYDNTYRGKSVKEQQVHFKNKKNQKLSKLLRSSSNFVAQPANEVVVLQNGKETFDTIFEALQKAEKFIHLQYYIFEEGELFDKLYSLLKEKLKNNVEVRILYDAIGSYALRKKAIKKLKDIGANVYPIMPLHFGSFLFTLNYRNHRKIIIIDGRIGFTGGVNISDKYISPKSELGIWDDTHLYLNGPAVDSLHRVFIKDYYFASNEELLLTNNYLPEIEKQGDVVVQIVAGGPDADHPSIMQQYITMINLAEEYIYISNPYFIPNNAMLEALRIAALSGVNIKLLVPKKSDSWLAKYSMLSFFEELLFLGIEIYQQKDDFLHSKVIIMDGEIASVGSGNFDHRSFEHNFETNALIYDSQIAESICTDFIADCKESVLLNYETYKKRSLKRKLSEGIARFFSPLL
ncbi:cardiolipin synthase [Aquimarina sp. MAR_2010_214]|uniref:cardiolipin synthase n=1 Tax=Aquimarina sp. MAR_2010_214 TaxID=1250026 RepID=UPI000CBBD802|nr:cardiolipin synthase [Aquimarina sp. MAR_2010_214]PKV50203.1 cardiolipin synthase [Aquimarina sp. MAR_2010_214]